MKASLNEDLKMLDNEIFSTMAEIENKIPKHEEIEPNKEAQETPALSHEGDSGVGLLLILNDYVWSCKHQV